MSDLLLDGTLRRQIEYFAEIADCERAGPPMYMFWLRQQSETCLLSRCRERSVRRADALAPDTPSETHWLELSEQLLWCRSYIEIGGLP